MRKYIFYGSLVVLSMGAFFIKTGEKLDYQAFIDSQAQVIEFGTLKDSLGVTITVTAYSPTEEECDDDPYITAFQKPVREGTIAISRDLEEEFGWSLGDKIHLKGLGVFVVWDRMHPRWKKKVDIFFNDQERALSFGIKRAVVLKVEKREKRGV